MTTVHAREISDLLALAGVDGAEEGYYDRLRVEDGELIESLFTPTGTDEKTVATDVHQETPASYLVWGTEVCSS